MEFLPYPQVIPLFCNTGGFGPRRGLTHASPCPWIAHPVSGLIPATTKNALFRLAFAPAPRLYRRLTAPAAETNSPDHSTKGTPSGLPPGRPKGESPSDCLWVLGFRVSFIPLSGCFSPFPHGTRALSVARWCLALEGGPPSFPQDFACPVVLRHSDPSARVRRLRGSHPLRRGVPDRFGCPRALR